MDADEPKAACANVVLICHRGGFEEEDLIRAGKFSKPRFGRAEKLHGPAAPNETNGAGVQGVMRQNEPGALFPGQAIFDQCQIQILVAAVNFIADDGVAKMGEMNADLMFAAGAGNYPQERKWKMEDGRWIGSSSFSPFVPEFRWPGTIKTALDPELGLGGRAVGANAVLDGDAAALIPAERGFNQAVAVAHVPADDGQVFLLDGAAFKDFPEFTGGLGIFGDEDDAAGFAVEAVNQMG